jgi:Chaperone of endosialidase
MPKTIPTNGQTNWGTALNSHIGQLMDPTYGGFNFVNTVEERNTRFPAVADNEGATVYNKSTGTFQVLESGPYTGVRWTDLGRTMSGSSEPGVGTLTYELGVGGNPKTYLTLNTGNIGNFVEKGDYIKVSDQFYYQVVEVTNANKVEVIISIDVRSSNIIVNGPLVSFGGIHNRNFISSVPDYFKVGDVVGTAGHSVWIIEKVNSTNYILNDSPYLPLIGTVTNQPAIILKRPPSGFSSWQVLKNTFKIADSVLSVSPLDSVGIKNPSFSYSILDNQLGLVTKKSGIDIIKSAKRTNSATNDGVGAVLSIQNYRDVGDGVDDSLSNNPQDWKGVMDGISGLRVSVGHLTDKLTSDSNTNSLVGISVPAYINSGNVKDVCLFYTGYIAWHPRAAALSTAWNMCQTRSNVIASTVNIKNYLGRTMINGGSFTLGETHSFKGSYDDINQALVVSGNILASGTVTQNSDITLKKDIKEIDSAVSKLSQIKGVTYKWKKPENHGDDETEQLGVIAQDVEKVFPQAVSTAPNGIKSVSYGDMVAPLIQAIKELKAEIEELKKKV